MGDQRTDGLEAQLFILEIIQFFQETVPELAGPSVDFELYIGRYTIRADTGNQGGGYSMQSDKGERCYRKSLVSPYINVLSPWDTSGVSN